jgi:hypothetical protein
MDELHGIFTTYEMRTEQENPYVKEAAFKASKRSKKKKKEQEEYSSSSDILEDDEEVSNFVKRLNKGTNGRYRGKLHLICFNCDGIGHFDKKCPHKKKRIYEGYSKGRQTYKGKRTTKKFSRKSFAPKKTSHHQMKMKSMIVKWGELYSWQKKTLIKKTPKKNMKKHMKKKLKR